MDAQTFKDFQAIAYQKAGIFLREGKAALVQARLADVWEGIVQAQLLALRLGELEDAGQAGRVRGSRTGELIARCADRVARAGAGTRIKILEAFAYRRPVVATRIGAEGLEVEDRRHLLLADSAEEFTEACLRLVNERSLSEQLADAAHRLVSHEYSPQVLARQLLAVGTCGEGRGP